MNGARQLGTDLTNCDREPIHVPGSIQPHGVLLALTEPELGIRHASASVSEHLGQAAEAAIGSSLTALLDAASVTAVQQALAADRVSDANPLDLLGRNGTRFDGIVHRHAGAAILELEPRKLFSEGGETASLSLRAALADLQAARSLDELGSSIVRAVRRMTGFERVMLYQFDEDDHGCVRAEVKADGLEPYLGLHYPASDIPKPARELYLRNWLRIIPDARYVASPIVPAAGAPLDLSFSVLRSVSPVHLEYLANMGVRASMSISLIVRERLWGLISCVNHSGPRFVSFETRSRCEALGRLVSLQIGALRESERAALREERRATSELLAEAMSKAAADQNLLEALAERGEELLELVHAGGAAVVRGETVHTVGSTPEPAFLIELSSWLGERGEHAPFVTSSLSGVFPPAEPVKDVASGLLTIALPGTPSRRLLWFRPERVHAVVWGGDPHKPVEGNDGFRLHPRRSFEKWKEEVRLRSRPWAEADADAAEELRRRAVEIDLARQLARAQSAVQLRDDLVAVVSHDLRSPLSVIQMQAALLLQSTFTQDDEPARRLRASSERIQRAIDHMMALITDLLDLAKIEAGRFELQPRLEDVGLVINESVLIVQPLAQAKRIDLRQNVCESCVTRVDRERLFQVLSNLIGNAIKFTPEGGRITVASRMQGRELCVSIEDTGPGIPEAALKKVFDRYWQVTRAQARSGSGLGLYIAKGIIEAHGGRIWAERAASGGARFTFVLPMSS